MVYWLRKGETADMPRQMRRLSESGIYHIMIRGNERKKLFFDDEDREKFIDILCEKKKEQGYLIYAYCLMDNHVHLLIKEEKDTIARIMKRINTSYAYYFNKKYQRVGHVFQDRFKSEPVETDAYLLAAVRYIHHNPVKANIVENASQYKWSSFNSYIYQDKLTKNFIERNFVLGMFADKEDEAIRLFIQFTGQGNQDGFIEYEDEETGNKTILSEKDAKIFIDNFLKDNDKGLNNTDTKNNLIKELRVKSNLSIRQIAEILGVNRGVVQRIVSKANLPK